MTNKTTSSNKILGIDTAADETVIALGDRVVSWTSDRNQTNELLPRIERLLKTAKIKPNQLAGVVVNLGPGSFTGLRVGVTVANGFGYGMKLPVAGIDQFDLLSSVYPKTDLVIIAAGRGEVFVKRTKAEPKLVKIEQLSAEVKSADIVCVDSFELIPQIHEQIAKAGTIHLVSLTKVERMKAMLMMAQLPKKFSQVLPVYVRGANITKPKAKKR